MNLAVNRILHGGAWDEIDKTTLSFVRGERWKIDKQDRFCEYLSFQTFVARIFYFSRVKDLEISGESWDYNIFNLKYRNIEILFFVCCSVTRFEQVESRLIFTFSIRVWKFLSIDARWTLALQWTILQSVSTFFKYQLSNSIMEHYMEDNQTKSSWYGFMEFEKDLMRKIGWIIETNFDRIRARFRSIPAQREKMIARQS